jgi:hypothetical protein
MCSGSGHIDQYEGGEEDLPRQLAAVTVDVENG